MDNLIDAKLRNQLHPDTFEIPYPARIFGLNLGDLAKIGFEQDGSGERFWVAIEEIGENHTQFVGRIVNNIEKERWGVGFGDSVQFNDRHIMDAGTTAEIERLYKKNPSLE